MAKITDLDQADSLDGDDELLIVQGSVSRRAPIRMVVEAASAQAEALATLVGVSTVYPWLDGFATIGINADGDTVLLDYQIGTADRVVYATVPGMVTEASLGISTVYPWLDGSVTVAYDANGELRVIDVAIAGDVPQTYRRTASSGGGKAPTIWHIVPIVGQSNADGRGSINLTIPTGLAKMFKDGALSDVTQDPIGSDQCTGSAWPSFANEYCRRMSNDIVQVGVIFVPSAVGGTSVVAAADSGSGNWSPAGTLRAQAVSNVNDAIAACEDAGLCYQLAGAVWAQGENDADAIDASTITIDDYTPALPELFAYFRSELSATMPIVMAQTGMRPPNDTAGYAAIREAERAFVQGDPLSYLGWTGAKDVLARGLNLGTSPHYLQPAYDEMGAFLAMTSASAFAGRA